MRKTAYMQAKKEKATGQPYRSGHSSHWRIWGTGNHERRAQPEPAPTSLPTDRAPAGSQSGSRRCPFPKPLPHVAHVAAARRTPAVGPTTSADGKRMPHHVAAHPEFAVALDVTTTGTYLMPENTLQQPTRS